MSNVEVCRAFLGCALATQTSNSSDTSKLPTDSNVIEPSAVQFHDFFDDIADATVATFEWGNVVADVADFGGSVGGTTGQTDFLHHRKIVQIVAHVKGCHRIDLVFGGVISERNQLVVGRGVEMLNTEFA